MAERCAPLETANSRYQRQIKRLLSRSDLKRATAAVGDVKSDFLQTAAAIGGRAEKWDEERQRAQARLRRVLARAVPNYRDVRNAQRNHRRELQGMIRRWHDITPVIGGVKVPDEPQNQTIFRAPFPLADTHIVKGGDAQLAVTDRSFVLPGTGQLILDADFDDDEHTSFSDGLWGLLYINTADLLASCGVSYTVPQTGRIRVTAEIRNFYNHSTLSMQDNFGFSSGTLWCYYELFASVLRPSRESRRNTLLFAKELTSDGDDVSAVMPDIDQSAPLVVDVTTNDTFAQGETVWVMVGSLVGVYSRLDDMHSHVRTLLWWQVNRIGVSMVA